MEGTAKVHIEDGVEVVVGHLRKRGTTDIARVVDQDVQAAEVVQRGTDDGASTRHRRHRIRGDHRVTAGSPDLPDDVGRWSVIATITAQTTSDIVDDHLRAA